MKISSLTLLKACTLSVALLGSAAIVAAVSVPDAAFAKSGNDNGNGGGNGNGNGGNGGGNGKSDKSGGGTSKADKKTGGSVEKTKKVKKTTTKAVVAPAVEAKPKKKAILDELGLSASDLGALNAARANPNALKNASPNSRVGKIAAYRDAVLAGQELEADLAEKTAVLAGLTAPDSPSADIGLELLDAQTETQARQDIVTDLEGVLAEDDPVLVAARADLAAAELAEAALQDEYDAAVEYETVAAEVEDLTQQVEDQPAVERDLLEAAANKPVTEEVEEAVRRLLGL
jgi:hypothetical protein